MASLNRVLLIGNVGKDPEIKTFASGNKVAQITLATSERYKDRNGEQKEETEWHSVQAFGKLADVVERFVHKGSLLYLDGKIRTRSYEADGRTMYRTEILADHIQMLDRRENRPALGPDEDLPDFLR
ncbi:MAG: single-stranded DNA-binding protein [Clostridia bacterium]|nr:single-stranded DNA-binding protein [Clostridia bacterium]